MATPVDKQAKELNYETPDVLLDPCREYFRGPIPLDPATSPRNPTKAVRFFTKRDNGLLQSWEPLSSLHRPGVFVNPPYGKLTREWIEKIVAASRGPSRQPVFALLSSPRSEQVYFQEMMSAASAVCWVRGRVSFLRPGTDKPAKGNVHASIYWAFNVEVARFSAIFTRIGLCRALEART